MRPLPLTDVVEESRENGVLRMRGPHGERVEIRALEPDIVRVWIMPDGKPRLDRTWMIGDVPFQGRDRREITGFSSPPLAPDGDSFRTAALRLEIRPSPFAIRWRDADGEELANDLSFVYDRSGTAIRHTLARREGDRFYGFGERSGPLDKRGRRMRMHNVDALGYDPRSSDPLYKHYPIYIVFDGVRAHGLLYDNLASCVFDMGAEIDAYHGPFRYYEAEGGDLDCYFIYGPTIAEVVEKIASLTGRPALPPRWALGYLGSTMTYTEAENAQEQLARFVSLCEEHRIPCDLFHLSSGYTLDENGRRNMFTWNRERIPDPAAMVARFRQAGMKIAANVKPCLLTSHPEYGDAAREGLFIRRAEGDAPELSAFWGGPGSYLDFTNSSTVAWWKRHLRERLLDLGVAAVWNDNNEFEAWDDAARCHGFGAEIAVGLARPLQTLLMGRASYEALREKWPELRPFLISRSACPGMQRWAQTWSGDNSTSWEALRYNIPMGLGLSLSGMSSTGHDVGGFAGEAPSPELFVRWIQNGIFHPRFTIHSWHPDGSVNEPWMYPEALDVVRDAIAFRYRLIPTLYALFFEAHLRGTPIIRPMVYAFPEDPSTHDESFDFMLGPHLLVASVLEDGARTRRVRLPRGTRWCDFHHGAWHEGEVELAAPLERAPLLVAENGIVVLGGAMRYVGEGPEDVREARIFPALGEGRFTLYEDDGVTLGYQRGEVTAVEVRVSASEEAVEVEVRASGGHPLPYREIEIVLPPGERRPLRGRIRREGARAFAAVEGEGVPAAPD
jgi:alpha-glucosidase